ncbi:MAG: DUF1616 domain-containing protein, partial [Candidatus Thermoplasmatota archaeon]|nr:DUF1616 domain-containing protein [Candidatus Thermoplasmatota archaeon]
MRIHFQERPWDLYIAGAYVAIMAAILLYRDLGLAVAILMVIFVPGYVLVAALFPGEKEIDWIERIALSFGLSIAVVPLLGLLLNFTFGIFFQPIVITILLFSEGLAAVAYVRRMSLPVEKRLSVTIDVKAPAWQEYSPMDKVLTVGLVASVVFSASVLGYVVTTPRPGERFTEFSILGPEGLAADYPTELNISEEGTIIIGVVSHEFEQVIYAIDVTLIGVVVQFNETSGFNETVEVNWTAMDSFDFTLDHDTNWTQTYAFSIPDPGSWKVELLLYR